MFPRFSSADSDPYNNSYSKSSIIDGGSRNFHHCRRRLVSVPLEATIDLTVASAFRYRRFVADSQIDAVRHLPLPVYCLYQ